ncbi:MAG TPA: hypothetical protein DIW30_03255 [Bacteroidales bacterium]|nr:hypothetical protein [Bacteroidales bacterium]
MDRLSRYIKFGLLFSVCLPVFVWADTPAIPTDTVRIPSPCIGSKVALKSSQMTTQSEHYLWVQTKKGNKVINDTLSGEARSIIIVATEPAEYVCDVVHSEVLAVNNLMANGDFETNPPTNFSSDYTYAGWDPSQYYLNHQGASNLYTITHDASWFWRDFYAVRPHGGNYFALFDAGKSGYAWKAETRDNPKLILEKDSVYLFSYWAAYPNKSPNNQPAQLQFVISYKDAGNTWKTENLGKIHILGNANPLNSWELREVRWKAPVASSEVMIGVFDKNTSEGGNDFCLDDIMFQKTTTVLNTVVYRTVFIVEPHSCDPPCPAPQTIAADTTLCLNTAFPVLWRGYEITKFGEQQFIVMSKHGCDSIIYNLNVLSRECDPCEGVVPVQVTFDTLVCDTVSFPLLWRGLSFSKADSRQQTTKSVLGCDSILSVYNLSLTHCPVPCVGIEMYAKWKDVIFVPDPDLVYTSYQWYHDGEVIAGATEQFYYNPQGLAGLYHCIMYTHSGDVVEACPAEFGDLTRSADLNPGNGNVLPVSRQSWWISPHMRIVVTTYSDHSVSAEKQLLR